LSPARPLSPTRVAPPHANAAGPGAGGLCHRALSLLRRYQPSQLRRMRRRRRCDPTMVRVRSGKGDPSAPPKCRLQLSPSPKATIATSSLRGSRARGRLRHLR
jgi:hypothetical protein